MRGSKGSGSVEVDKKLDARTERERVGKVGAWKRFGFGLAQKDKRKARQRGGRRKAGGGVGMGVGRMTKMKRESGTGGEGLRREGGRRHDSG